MDQTIRFVTTDDGVKLAYAISGSGPPLVKTANWLNHLEYDWESPVWRHWFRLFSNHHTFYRYDVRGSGLSDHVDTGLDFDRQITDLECVVDAAGLETFALLGISQGASVAIEYAARHPERVTRIVLHGGFVQGWAARDAEAERAGRAWVELVRVGWGQESSSYRRMFAELFIPGATAEQLDWFGELQRRTTTPELAALIMEASSTIDVVDRMRDVKAPAMVLHPRGDMVVPFDQGREAAAAIPQSVFIALESDHHLLIEGEPAWYRFQSAVGEFLGWQDAKDETESPAVAGTATTFHFDHCILDARSRELLRQGELVPIEQRVLNLLIYLIENRDRAVSKDELQGAVWPRMILTESALTRCVMKARRAVGDDSQRQSVIKTVHGHGYRFIAPLKLSS